MKTLLLVILITASFFACKKDEKTPSLPTTPNQTYSDTIPPQIYIIGDNPSFVKKGENYIDQGAIAIDNSDTIPLTVAGSVNIQIAGTYTLTYHATDSSGNVNSKTRWIYVIDFTSRQYDVADIISGPSSGTYTYTTILNPSWVNNRIEVSNFGGFGSTVIVYIDISGNTLTIPAQNINGTWGNGTVSGTGSITGGNAQKINLNYSVVYSSGTDVCLSDYSLM